MHWGVIVGGAILGSLACISVAAACLVAGIVIGATGSFIDSSIEANERGYTGARWSNYVREKVALGAVTGAVGGGFAAAKLAKGLMEGTKKAGEITFKEFRKDVVTGSLRDEITSESLDWGLQEVKNRWKSQQSTNKKVTPLKRRGRR